MKKKKEVFEKGIIDKKLILPSFINKEYLEKKFNDSEEDREEELNNDFNQKKIIIEHKKLTIFEVDKENNLENKIYESNDFTEVIKKLTKIEKKKNNFHINLVKSMKNGIFIIESKNMATYGAFFFIKYNKSKKEIEIISEEDGKIEFITEYSDGNFAYNCYIHRPVYTEDTFYIFNINKNEKYSLINFGEYDAFNSKYALLTNGFAFNNFIGYKKIDETSYLNIVEGFNLKRYVINFIRNVKQLISDDKYIYLLSIKAGYSVYIFNIEHKKFYSKYFKIWSKMNEPKEIEYDKDLFKNEEENENSNRQNLIEKMMNQCIIC